MRKPRERAKMPKRVLVALWMAGKSGRDSFAGIHRFLAEGHEWEVELVRTREGLLPALRQGLEEGRFDGLITSYEEQVFQKLLLSSEIPVIAMDIPFGTLLEGRKHTAFLLLDEEHIARCAMDAFLEQGRPKGIGYVRYPLAYGWNLQRGRAFREEAQRRGFDCEVFEGGMDPSLANGTSGETPLTTWLRNLPRPAAVFAANDDQARVVLDACKAVRLRVPRDIAILGVDDDEMVCARSRPTLSSLQLDREEAGYRAAAMLEEMMQGRVLDSPKTVPCGVRRLVRRQSLPTSTAVRLVQRTVDYIQERACDGIGAVDVVRHAKVSRSLLELRFREVRGESLLDAIQERRLAEVRRRLLETQDSIEAITYACGYHGVNYLKTLFRKRFGMTMRDFRKTRLLVKS